MTSKNKYQYIDLEYIYDLADGDSDFAAEILTGCIETIGPNMKKLAEAVKTNDEEAALFLTHKLKGSFRFVGCNADGNTVEEMEKLLQAGAGIDEVSTLLVVIEGRYVEIERELQQALAETGQ